ncbi:MAG: hypothetical protein P8P52_02425 [Opitutae bacterium]|jgi:hypothetical protein|nr:hypothetical protein [Opitutae bacterium]
MKLAISGCSARGGTHYNQLSAFKGTEIVGICDYILTFSIGRRDKHREYTQNRMS